MHFLSCTYLNFLKSEIYWRKIMILKTDLNWRKPEKYFLLNLNIYYLCTTTFIALKWFLLLNLVVACSPNHFLFIHCIGYTFISNITFIILDCLKIYPVRVWRCYSPKQLPKGTYNIHWYPLNHKLHPHWSSQPCLVRTLLLIF